MNANYSRLAIEAGQQVTLAELREIIREYEREQAYGSETYGLTLWADWASDKADTDLIPQDDILWWYDYYDAQGLLPDLHDDDRDSVQSMLDSGEPESALALAEQIIDQYDD